MYTGKRSGKNKGKHCVTFTRIRYIFDVHEIRPRSLDQLGKNWLTQSEGLSQFIVRGFFRLLNNMEVKMLLNKSLTCGLRV